MSLDKIKAKLAALNAASQKTTPSSNGDRTLFWKPGQNKDEKGVIQTDLIRILPNKHTEPGYPFAELYFYYDFGKTWISPTCFSQPDPIVEYCNGLTSGERLSKEEFVMKSKIKRKLLPKERVYVPILVRGLEHEGVKFWGFSKTIFNQLLETMADDDYGDITDLKTGRDVTVKFVPAAKEGEFAKTSIMVKPNQSVATTDTEVLNKISEMPNVAEQFTCPEEKELKDALAKYLQIEPEQSKPTTQVGGSVKANHDATNEGFDVKVQIPDSKPSVDISDIESMFDDLMK